MSAADTMRGVVEIAPRAVNPTGFPVSAAACRDGFVVVPTTPMPALVSTAIARRAFGPAAVPNRQVVAAVPSNDVTTDGAPTDPPPPVTSKTTVTPGTPTPSSFTTCT